MSMNLARRGLQSHCKSIRSWTSTTQHTRNSRGLGQLSTSSHVSCAFNGTCQSRHHLSRRALPSSRTLHTSPRPQLPESSSSSPSPAPLTIEAYHEYADSYLETLVNRLEDLGERKADLDVEFSAGVLNCVFPPAGTYVLNKQPPNKQIWLSSPISGPKRFDYIVQPGLPEAAGEWIYLRDNSKLTDLLKEELGVDVVEGAEEG